MRERHRKTEGTFLFTCTYKCPKCKLKTILTSRGDKAPSFIPNCAKCSTRTELVNTQAKSI